LTPEAVPQRCATTVGDVAGRPLPPRLEAVLLADAARERARAVRDLLIAVVAVLGLPLWFVAAWPGRFPTQLRVLAATGWAVAALAVVITVVRAHWWTRVRSRRVEALGPLPTLRSERLGGGACAPAADEED
jgi:hypothetical protein